MKITAISDLHGFLPDDLPGGHLLILAGDYTRADKVKEWVEFYQWINKQNYEKIVYIGGNHDGFLSYGCDNVLGDKIEYQYDKYIEYLCDTGTEFMGYKIWGTPHSLLFPGVNPLCTSFMGTENSIGEKFNLIPKGIDILISHSPPYGILDSVRRFGETKSQSAGSKSLRKAVKRVLPMYSFFGHIHEHGNKGWYLKTRKEYTFCYNVSYVNRNYEPVNKVLSFEIEDRL